MSFCVQYAVLPMAHDCCTALITHTATFHCYCYCYCCLYTVYAYTWCCMRFCCTAHCCEQLCWPILHLDAAAEGSAVSSRVAMAVAELYRAEGPFEPQVINGHVQQLELSQDLRT
jgi:hypothetical protein